MSISKRVLTFFLAFVVLFVGNGIYCSADTDETPLSPQEQPAGTRETDVDTVPDMGLTCGAAVLMEASSGTVLYRMNESDELPPASVTKIMTLLLVMEALEAGNLALTDTVTISGYAASMGGSQVFLEEGEQMSVEDLIKCTVIASANDAAVALAEQVMGSETAFVERMNRRAAELGLTGAHFENVTGLDDDTENHVMSAMDIAVISRELIRHPLILEYSSVWMDTIRDGAFTLTNTNRLIRFYQGATGLKTGSTEKAKFCITATAERNGMTLIAVIMTAPSRDDRNSDAKKLFDWGFANWGVYRDAEEELGPVKVSRGLTDSVKGLKSTVTKVLPKSKIGSAEKQISLEPGVQAPIQAGTQIGTVTYLSDGEIIETAPILAAETVEEIGFWQLIGRMMKILLLS